MSSMQEMRCASSLSLQGWGTQISQGWGWWRGGTFRFSVFEAGGQLLMGRVRIKEYGSDVKKKI